jgi:hypothetical protein
MARMKALVGTTANGTTPPVIMPTSVTSPRWLYEKAKKP